MLLIMSSTSITPRRMRPSGEMANRASNTGYECFAVLNRTLLFDVDVAVVRSGGSGTGVAGAGMAGAVVAAVLAFRLPQLCSLALLRVALEPRGCV